MKNPDIYNRDFTDEFEFHYTKSSGPGGQHVNKTESKVELRFLIQDSMYLSEKEKEKLKLKLKNKINQDGYLIITSQESRSQFRNKEIVVQRFYEIINEALFITNPRIPTKPSVASIEKRIEKKKKISEKKKLRRNISGE